jgi:hypothetical protein
VKNPDSSVFEREEFALQDVRPEIEEEMNKKTYEMKIKDKFTILSNL